MKIMKAKMNKSNIARFFVLFFLACTVISIRYFDNEGAAFFVMASIVAGIFSIIYFKLNQ